MSTTEGTDVRKKPGLALCSSNIEKNGGILANQRFIHRTAILFYVYLEAVLFRSS